MTQESRAEIETENTRVELMHIKVFYAKKNSTLHVPWNVDRVISILWNFRQTM